MEPTVNESTRRLDLKIQLISVWCGPIFVVVFLAFFWLVAGYVPPRSAEWDADRIALWYDDHRTAIRVGQVGALSAVMFLIPFWLIICSYIREIERGRIPILYRACLVGATMNFVWFGIPSLAWLMCTFREGMDPKTLQSWHDFGWFVFLMPFAAYTVNLLTQGVAILTDTSADPMWPRWVGYFNLMLIPTSFMGGFIVFFKDGPLAWNGIFGFYILCICYVSWILLMAYTMNKTLRRRLRALNAGAAREPAEPMTTVSGS